MGGSRWIRWLARLVYGALGLGALGLGVAGGCDSPQTLEGGLVLGTVDAPRLCDVHGVQVRLRAQWLECLPDAPDCAPPSSPTVAGDRASCPINEPDPVLGVELPTAGIHRIEVVTEQVSGPERVECFVDPDTGQAEIPMTPERIAEGVALALHEHGPCP